jgi:DNA-binding response OmpR family regulator
MVLEKELLKYKNGVVKYSDLADVVWGEEAEFSLWALSRLAGRVKKKLAEMGYGGMIENVRGVGYRYQG